MAKSMASIGAFTLAATLVFGALGAQPADAAAGGIWISDAELDVLPTTGAAWNVLVTAASASPIAGNATLIDQDSMHSRNTMAAALYAARVHSVLVRTKVRDAIRAVKGTELSADLASNRLLQLGRNLPGYVIAADLIDLKVFDPTFDAQFRVWIGAMRTKVFKGHFGTIANADEHDAANWGAYDGAARAAIAAYLGDTADLARSAAALKSFTNEVHDGRWDFGTDVHDMSWQCTYTNEGGYVAINGACSRDGHNVDGFMAQDMARAGAYQWPPIMTHYVRENLNGRVIQAEILRRAGYPAVFSWGDRAFLRAAAALRRLDAFDDGWFEPDAQVHRIIATRHSITTWGLASNARGRAVSGVDWTHGPGSTTPALSPVPPAPTASLASTPSPKPTPTPTPTVAAAAPGVGAQVQMQATDDAKVLARSPDRNYAVSNLQVRNDDHQSFVRFDVKPTEGRRILRAVLRLYVTDAAASSGAAYQTGTDWNEASLTWNTRPTVIGPALGRGGVAEIGGYVAYDVTAAAMDGGPVSFVLRTGAKNSVLYASTESDADRGPELVLTFAQ